MAEPPWHLRDLGIDALHAITRGTGIRVAVLDSGVTPTDGLFSSLRSFSPRGHEIDSVDDDGHGSACASLIASKDENAPGVAPDVELLSIPVSAGGNFIEQSVKAAFLTARELGCQVISCSFTLLSPSSATLEAIRQAANSGIVVVAASGNDPNRPAGFPELTPNVLVVGPYGRQRELLQSRFGTFTDVLAPGADLCVAGGPGLGGNFGGSSGATAIVAGVVALVLAATKALGTAKVGLAIEGLAKATADMASGGERLLTPIRLLNAAQRLL